MTSEQAWLKFGDLELDGFVVDCAQTAEAGLALARSQTYDLILLDHRLPDRFGTDLLPDLTPRERPVPLIVLTGFGEVDGAVSAIRDGPAAYKQKPIEGAVLVALIRDVLEKFRTRHDHASGADADPKAIELERLETVYGRLGTCISKRELTGIILRTLFDRRLTLRSFPGCAAALRHVVTTADTSVLLIGLEVRRLISTAAATPLPGHPKLIAAVAGLEAGGIKQSQAIFAQHRTLSRAYLSHLVTMRRVVMPASGAVRR
jgi:ActR/RegA family two-component response regulator